MTAVALGALGWVATAQAQNAPEGTPAPAMAPAPAAPAAQPAPAPAPAPAPEAAPAPADTAPAASTPAPDAGSAPAAAPAKTKHHKSMHASKGKTMSMHRGAEGGDAAVEDLNAKSLSAAKSGSNYTPSKADEAPMKSTSKTSKPMHHHHHMAKKKAAPSDAAAAPADSGTDTSKYDTKNQPGCLARLTRGFDVRVDPPAA
jgi:hypothetical protein